MNETTSRAPCEACPPHCGACAWDRTPARSDASTRRLMVIRDATSYGCVRSEASIVLDQELQQPFMKIGEELLPLSVTHSHVIYGTRLEADISSARV